MTTRIRAMLLGVALAAVAATARADGDDTAIVTAVQGGVTRVAPGNPQALQAFSKLRHGDLLALDKAVRLQLVYFDSGRQETWQGTGRLEVTRAGGVAHGLAEPQVKTLPPVLVKQIAKTPALESQGRVGMMRLRSVATAQDVARAEETYKRLRGEAERDDLNPELYLLSSMFELRELDRVDQILKDLQQSRPGNPEVGVLVALYQKAVRNARESKGQ